MIYERINELLKEAMLSKNTPVLEVLRAFKTEVTKFHTSGSGKEFNEVEELKILNKMISTRKESEEIFRNNGRLDLAELEKIQLAYLSTLVPKSLGVEEAREIIVSVITEYKSTLSGKLSMKDMKPILSKVQEKEPTITSKQVSDVLKSVMIN